MLFRNTYDCFLLKVFWTNSHLCFSKNTNCIKVMEHLVDASEKRFAISRLKVRSDSHHSVSDLTLTFRNGTCSGWNWYR